VTYPLVVLLLDVLDLLLLVILLRFRTQFFTVVPNFDDSGHHRDYLYYKVRWVKLFKLEIQGYKPVTAKPEGDG